MSGLGSGTNSHKGSGKRRRLLSSPNSFLLPVDNLTGSNASGKDKKPQYTSPTRTTQISGRYHISNSPTRYRKNRARPDAKLLNEITDFASTKLSIPDSSLMEIQSQTQKSPPVREHRRPSHRILSPTFPNSDNCQQQIVSSPSPSSTTSSPHTTPNQQTHSTNTITTATPHPTLGLGLGLINTSLSPATSPNTTGNTSLRYRMQGTLTILDINNVASVRENLLMTFTYESHVSKLKSLQVLFTYRGEAFPGASLELNRCCCGVLFNRKFSMMAIFLRGNGVEIGMLNDGGGDGDGVSGTVKRIRTRTLVWQCKGGGGISSSGDTKLDKIAQLLLDVKKSSNSGSSLEANSCGNFKLERARDDPSVWGKVFDFNKAWLKQQQQQQRQRQEQEQEAGIGVSNIWGSSREIASPVSNKRQQQQRTTVQSSLSRKSKFYDKSNFTSLSRKRTVPPVSSFVNSARSRASPVISHSTGTSESPPVTSTKSVYRIGIPNESSMSDDSEGKGEGEGEGEVTEERNQKNQEQSNGESTRKNGQSRITTSAFYSPSRSQFLRKTARLQNTDANDTRKAHLLSYTLDDDDNDNEDKERDIIREFKPSLNYRFTDGTSYTITNQDFKCLYNNDWINDTIIDFFIKYFVAESISNGITKEQEVCILSSFFYTKLISKPEDYYGNVKKWVQNSNLLEKKYIVVPVNTSFHWFGCIITNLNMLAQYLKEKGTETRRLGETEEPKEEAISVSQALDSPRVRYNFASDDITSGIPAVEILTFDSLRGQHTRDIDPIKDFLVAYALDSHGIVIDRSWIKMKNCLVPQQPNMSDCGVHVILTVKKFFENPEKTISVWRSIKRKCRESTLLVNEYFEKNKRNSKARKDLRSILWELHSEQERMSRDEDGGVNGRNNPGVKRGEEKDGDDDGDIEIIEDVSNYNKGENPKPQSKALSKSLSAVNVSSYRSSNPKFESNSSPDKNNYLDSHDNDCFDDDDDHRYPSNVSTPLSADVRLACSQELQQLSSPSRSRESSPTREESSIQSIEITGDRPRRVLNNEVTSKFFKHSRLRSGEVAMSSANTEPLSDEDYSNQKYEGSQMARLNSNLQSSPVTSPQYQQRHYRHNHHRHHHSIAPTNSNDPSKSPSDTADEMTIYELEKDDVDDTANQNANHHTAEALEKVNQVRKSISKELREGVPVEYFGYDDSQKDWSRVNRHESDYVDESDSDQNDAIKDIGIGGDDIPSNQLIPTISLDDEGGDDI